jgi:predicted dehydrogenase
MVKKTTRWAMIGTGGMALRIIRDFKRTEGVELTTIVSRSREKGLSFAAQWEIPNVVTDLERLWETPSIDVVYVATPNSEHYRLARAAIQAHKHVVVEKPITMTSAQARDLVALARAAGVFLMEAMWTRFNPTILKVQDVIHAGRIGDVRNVLSVLGFPIPYEPENRMWDPNLGGGGILDLGVYCVTLANLFLGSPSSVVARGRLFETGVDLEASVFLGYPGGKTAIVATSMMAMLTMPGTICGTLGQIVLDSYVWSPTGYRVVSADNLEEHFEVPMEGSGYVPMLRAASQAVLDGRMEHQLNPLSGTIGVMDVLDEVVRQLKLGSP